MALSDYLALSGYKGGEGVKGIMLTCTTCGNTGMAWQVNVDIQTDHRYESACCEGNLECSSCGDHTSVNDVVYQVDIDCYCIKCNARNTITIYERES